MGNSNPKACPSKCFIMPGNVSVDGLTPCPKCNFSKNKKVISGITYVESFGQTKGDWLLFFIILIVIILLCICMCSKYSDQIKKMMRV